MIQFFRSLRARQYVRPWALAAPIVVLIIALPLLRPLRRPMELSMQEATRLAAVQSLVEHHQFMITAANLSSHEQPDMPVFTLLLAGPYWLLHQMGYRLSRDTAMVSYLLTVICSTIPAAAVTGLIYRMARVFQLSRPVRLGMAVGVVLCSGLISYATVINPHAPAACFILAAAASLIHVALVPKGSGGSLALAGLFSGLAAVIDLSAAPFLFLLPIALLAVRGSISWRIGAILFFIIGAILPVALHEALSDDLIYPKTVVENLAIGSAAPASGDEDQQVEPPSVFDVLGHGVGNFLEALLGPHGLLSHFPVIILAVWGIASILHRHWPVVVKMLAILTLCGALGVIIWVAANNPGDPGQMYASRYFIAFSPLLLFWSGAWLRSKHGAVIWGIAIFLIAFSGVVGVIGAINPYPPNGYERYTPVAAIAQMLRK